MNQWHFLVLLTLKTVFDFTELTIILCTVYDFHWYSDEVVSGIHFIIISWGRAAVARQAHYLKVVGSNPAPTTCILLYI